MAFLTEAANRGSISTGYEIDNSLKVEPDNGERFDTGDKFTNYSSVRKFTVSVWLKRTELTVQSLIWFNSNTATSVQLEFGSDDKLVFLLQDNVGNGVESYAKTSALFRDTSAWYHVVLAVDTTDGTAANRTKIYVNGVNQTLEQGNASYDTFPAQNYDCPLQTKHYLLGYDGGNNGFRGYAAEYYFLDGITASPTDFGEFDEDSGIWKPKAYTGSFGNEGYYLDFEDASALGKDVSSNNQGNFTHYGGSAADQATDTPTNNFCTFNPTFSWIYSGNDAASTILNGGTTADNIALTPGTAWKGAVGTMAVNKGKWYWEWENNSGAFGHRTHGILTTEYAVKSVYASDDYSNQLVFRDGGTPRIFTIIDGTASNPHLMTPYSDGLFVYGIALNMDDEEATFYRNGTAMTISGTSTTAIDISAVDGVTKYVYPLYSCYGATEAHYNFGGFTAMGISSGASDANGYGTFEYAPPSGYYALCTKNLAEYG